MDVKYLNPERTQELIDETKRRLGTKQDTIQVTTMPTAAAALVGKVYQYIGTTSGSYTHNYFYECKADTSTTPATYSWEQVNVQPDGSGNVDIATPEINGISKPDDLTVFIDSNGTLRTKVWSGTLARYVVIKDQIPNDTTIIITDSDEIPSNPYIVNGVKIVPWSTGSYTDIAAMIAGHDAGKINIHDYWAVGDNRQVSISALPGGWDDGNGESQVAKTAYMTIMDTEYGNNNIHFTVATSFGLYSGYMNYTDTNAGGWKDSARRYWCNNVLYNGFETGFKNLLKPFNVLTPESELNMVTTTDYLSIIAFTELHGKLPNHGAGVYDIEQNTLSQFKIFSEGIWRADRSYSSARFRAPVPNSNTDFYDNSSWRTGQVTGKPASSTTGTFVIFGCI